MERLERKGSGSCFGQGSIAPGRWYGTQRFDCLLHSDLHHRLDDCAAALEPRSSKKDKGPEVGNLRRSYFLPASLNARRTLAG